MAIICTMYNFRENLSMNKWLQPWVFVFLYGMAHTVNLVNGFPTSYISQKGMEQNQGFGKFL